MTTAFAMRAGQFPSHRLGLEDTSLQCDGTLQFCHLLFLDVPGLWVRLTSLVDEVLAHVTFRGVHERYVVRDNAGGV